VSQAWVLYAAGLYDEAVRMVKKAIERKRDCEGAYYLLFRGLFAAGRCQEVVDLSESAIEASGEDYNVYVPILNSLGSLDREDFSMNMTHRFCAALENHLKQVPEDARARVLLGANYAKLSREQDALRELQMAVTLRADESSILYNAACTYCRLNRRSLGRSPQSMGRRFTRSGLDASRPRSAAPPRRPRVRAPLPRKTRLRRPLARGGELSFRAKRRICFLVR
jgi:non-specific serine/threonine protein kinase